MILVFSFTDGFRGAFGFAGTAGDAFIGNDIGHGWLPSFFLAKIFSINPASIMKYSTVPLSPGRPPQSPEQGMGPVGPGFELGMKLGGHKPGMVF
jgi:hypothetical protein